MVLTDGADRWLLTCLHVVARRDGNIVASDEVSQPDASRGSIARLHSVRFDQSLDCAAVKLVVPSVTEVLGIGGLAAITAPVVGMQVIKSGWKTGVTHGRIESVIGPDVAIALLADFPNDYLLATTGDSGAVWVEATTFAPVALHKSESAVGRHLAFATDISAILSSLNLAQA